MSKGQAETPGLPNSAAASSGLGDWEDVSVRTQDFVTSRGLLTNAADAIERIMSSYKEVDLSADVVEKLCSCMPDCHSCGIPAFKLGLILHNRSRSSLGTLIACQKCSMYLKTCTKASTFEHRPLLQATTTQVSALINKPPSIGPRPKGTPWKLRQERCETYFRTNPVLAEYVTLEVFQIVVVFFGCQGHNADGGVYFDRVPIVTPAGDVLVREMTVGVPPGRHLLITGPNGCGKSSFFRTLGGLWPVSGGTLTRPPRRSIFYIPQVATHLGPTHRIGCQLQCACCSVGMSFLVFLCMHLFRNHTCHLARFVINWCIRTPQSKLPAPQTSNLMPLWPRCTWVTSCGVKVCPKVPPSTPSKFYMQLLNHRDLSPCSAVAGGWDAVKTWEDVLSGGEKQRVGLARLFYHKPRFAILDECTSAVSIDVEGEIYQAAKDLGVTLLTVSHRPSLWKYHSHILSFDGAGGYKVRFLFRNNLVSSPRP